VTEAPSAEKKKSKKSEGREVDRINRMGREIYRIQSSVGEGKIRKSENQKIRLEGS